MFIYRPYSVHAEVINWKISVSKIMCCWLEDLVRFPSESHFTITSRQPWSLSGFFPIESGAPPQGCSSPGVKVFEYQSHGIVELYRHSSYKDQSFHGISPRILFLDCLTLKMEALLSETLVIFLPADKGVHIPWNLNFQMCYSHYQWNLDVWFFNDTFHIHQKKRLHIIQASSLMP
jgi:hypothetical protein